MEGYSSVTMIPSIDSVVPVPMQEAMYERAVKAGGSVERILLEGAGHGLPVSRTDLVVEQMIKLASVCERELDAIVRWWDFLKWNNRRGRGENPTRAL
ncbi:uncharacterized protein N7469_003243 [Penicillium citrinum]|uniref:Uncharacterized protein n=1 Tax=Penicillium citrinum TaxID=5077 RepID=A0A9W9PC38_PENCI|nr:uncharacterized protein N7469_003243 [Penicillium citrinum]KAJ5241652.1 hypothetical protein N7469_003243 [Penicillium citrinum]